MALIQCPECKKEISDKAAVCPHCGCPVSATNKSLSMNPVSKQGVAPRVQNVPVVRPTYQPTKVKRKRQNGKKTLGIVTVILVVLLLFVLISTHTICLFHNYSKATVVEPQTCDYCGKTQGEPKPLTEIDFPTAGVGALLPLPESNMGEVNWNHYDSFSMYVGNTTYDDYSIYINKCMEAGFNINFHQYEDSFSAYDSNGNDLNIDFRGNDIMEVYIHTTDREEVAEELGSETIIPYLAYIGEYVGDNGKISLAEELYNNMSDVEFMGMNGEVSYTGDEEKIMSCEWISSENISESEYNNFAERIIKNGVEIVSKVYDDVETYCYYWDDYGYSISMVHGIDEYDPNGAIKIEWENLGHNWNPASCTEPKTCWICDKTEGEPLEHNWVDATCTEPITCSICGKTDGDTLNHIPSDWTMIEKPTISNSGREERVCTVCNGTIDSRDIEKKQTMIDDKSFNFTDDELIDWINDISTMYVSSTDLELFDTDNTSYRITTSDDEVGALILNHGDNGKDGNICAIMTWFDDSYYSGSLAAWLGEKINSDFSTDSAIDKFINDESYTAADMTVTSIYLDADFEVYILAPSEFLAEILT